MNAVSILLLRAVVVALALVSGTHPVLAIIPQPPTISAIADQVINEDGTTGALAFTISDPDTPVTRLSLTATSSNTGLIPTAAVVLGGTGGSRTVTATPAANQNGSATITVTVSDGTSSRSELFTVSVTPVNDTPTITNLRDQKIPEDGSTGSMGFTIGDVETAAGSLSVSAASDNTALAPLNRILFGGTGASRTVTVNPAPNAFGSAVITVTVSDGAASASDTFNLTVDPVNDVPTITTLGAQSTPEDTVLGPLAFTVGDVETAPESLVVTVANNNATLYPGGSLVLGGTGAARTLTYTPPANLSGSGLVTVTVSDGVDTASFEFSLTVTAVNDPPQISAVADQAINEDTVLGPIAFTVTDVEPSNFAPTVTATSSNQTLVPDTNIVLGGTGQNRTVTVTPTADQSGSALITLTANDGGATSTETFTLVVNPLNDAPSLGAIPDISTTEDVTGTAQLTVSDKETVLQDLVLTAISSNSALVAPGGVTFAFNRATVTMSVRPEPNAFGTADITVTVSDGAATASDTFTLTVRAVNDAPSIDAIATQTTSEDTPTGSIAITLVDVDTAGTSLTLTGSSSDTAVVANTGLAFGGTGNSRSLVVTPQPNASGSTLITLTVNDGEFSAGTSFTLNVTAVNDAPSLSPPRLASTPEDTPTPALAFSIGDTETSADLLTVTGSSSNTGLVPNANVTFGGSGSSRTVTLTPAANQSGTTTITLSVSDGTTTTSGTFLLTVDPVNDSPTIADVVDRTVPEDSVAGPLPVTIGDVETAAGNLTLTATSSNTALVPNGNIVLGGSGASRTITLTPLPNQSGASTITLTVSDGTATASDTFVLNVTSGNDAPTVSNITDQSTNEDTATGAIGFTVDDAETPAASLTVTASSSNTTLVPNNAIVFGGAGASRTLTATPAANQSGTTTITVTVSDGTATASDTFVLTVNAVNDAPTIADIVDRTIPEDSVAGPLPVVISDVETAAGNLTLTASSSNTALLPNNNIVLGGSGGSRTITLTPLPNQGGSSTITVTVSDGTATASDTFVLTVSAANDTPTISNIADLSTPEDTDTGPIAFTVDDAETAAASLSVTGSSSNTTLVPNNALVFGGSGASRTLTITPAANQSGTTTITVTVSDGSSSATDTFVLTVTAVNDLPTISNIADQSTNEDTATAALSFTVGDTETAAASLTLTGTSSNTSLVPNNNVVFGGSGANRTVTLTPAANQSGSSTITVTVSDGTGTATDTFLLTVVAVNDPPTIADVVDRTIAEDAVAGPLPVTIGDVETAAANLTLTVASSNTALVPNGSISLGGSGASRTITLTPAANQSGASTITLTVSDGTATASDTFVLTVTAANDAPTIANVADQATNEDTATPAIAFGVGDVETAAGNLTVAGTSSNTALVPNAGITFGGSGANRTVTLTPTANQTGTTTITLTVSDGAASASDSFVLTVNAVNDLPTLSNITDQSTPEDVPTAAIAFTVGDVETAVGNLTLTGASSNTGLLPVSGITFGGAGASRTVTLTPAANQSGTSTVTVTVSDGTGSASDTFVLTVTAVNDPPTISSILGQTTAEGTPTPALAFTVGDAETAAASLVVTGTSSNLGLVPANGIVLGGAGANRTVTVTPTPGLAGASTITLTVSDGALTATTQFNLTVSSVNDAPTISNISDQSTLEDTATAAIAFTVGDAESPAAGLNVSGSSSNPTLVPLTGLVFGGGGASRTLTITPASNASGSATITVTVSDGALSASDTFVLTVTAVNDPPTVSDIPAQSFAEDTNSPSIAYSVADVETAAANLSVTVTSSNEALLPSAGIIRTGNGTSRTLVLVPAANQNGSSTITVTVTDGLASGSRQFLATVVPVNDPPTISDIGGVTIQSGSGSGAIAFTVGDLETPPQNLSVTAVSANLTLVPAAGIVLGGAGANRTVTVTPALNQVGSTEVTVSVSDGAASASDSFVVTVSEGVQAPKIVSPPANVVVRSGEIVELKVEATGTGPLRYQWFRNDFPLSNATEATLTLRNIQANQAGTYTVQVSNSAGSIKSEGATVTVQSFDFGDSPDGLAVPGYPTLLANNGARHLVVDGFWLGKSVDVEADAATSVDGTGDNAVGAAPADEDGVVFLSPILTSGQSVGIVVTLTGQQGQPARLDAFADWNQDKTWSVPSERVLSSVSLIPGPNTLTFLVPGDAKPGSTFMRFRLSREGGLTATGEAKDGEVEDYLVRVEATQPPSPLDFGDAPDSSVALGYPTQLANNGARHTIVQGFHLGERVDGEANGTPDANATGDDLNPAGADDEDGVEFVGPVTAGQTASVVVTASQAGRLDAWADFNSNKSWNDQGEQIFSSTTLIAGKNSLVFQVPPTTLRGFTYFRFRLSKNGKLGPTGAAPDGEVEDYRVEVKRANPCDLSSLGTDFWVTFPGNYAPHPDDKPEVTVQVVGTAGTTGKVEAPGLSFSKEFQIPASQTVTVVLPRAADLGNAIDVVQPKGVRITSSAPVSVFGLNHIKHTSDGFLALPVEVLGQSYVAVAYKNVHKGVSALNGTQFAIVSPQDETTVTITPRTALLGHPAGVPFEVVLNEGQTYQLRDPNNATADLTGTLVTSDKPVAIFGGHQCANVNSPSTFFCDYLVEQLQPTVAWGKEYYVTPLETRLGGSTYRVVAAYDNTVVSVGNLQVATLDRGEVHDRVIPGAARITGSKAIQVVQYSHSSDSDDVENADPFMIQVPSTRTRSKSQVMVTAPGNDFTKHFVNVVAPSVAAGSITRNGVAIPAASFTAIGATGFSYAKVPVNPGVHTFVGQHDFSLTGYGFGQYDSYGWSGPLHFGDLTPPEIVCPPDFTRSIGQVTAGVQGCFAIVPDLRPLAKVTDNCLIATDGRSLEQTPLPGTFLGLGQHEIVLTATDAAGNSASCSVTMTVVDDGKLTLHCPQDIVRRCTKGSGANVHYEVYATTPCGTVVPLVCDPPSGSFFKEGVTEVKAVLNDPKNPLTCSFKVTVGCKVNITQLNGQNSVVLNWEPGSVLEEAPSINGPWKPVPGVQPPFVPQASGPQRFFRVRIEETAPQAERQ